MNTEVQTIQRGTYKDGDGDVLLDDYWLLTIEGKPRPGHFSSIDVAKYAMPFDGFILKDLQDRANDRSPGTLGTITQRDLEMAYVRAEVLHGGVHLAREEWLDAGMTPDELVVLTMTIALWNRLVDLPTLHDRDGQEWAYMMHKIQDKIAARVFLRAAAPGESDT